MAALADVRVAISQPTMHWAIDENLREVDAALQLAADRGAELVLFPELTLTGFHTKVPDLLDRGVLEGALARVAECCRASRVAAAVGTPAWCGGERPRDCLIVLDARGEELGRCAKMRLMPPGEPMVFEAGTERPLLRFGGTTLGVVICREILDEAELTDELAGQAQAILWPGMMARPRGDAAVRATALARQQGAWIFHSNWAVNVEAPSIPHTGKSLVISPQGELVLEAPARQAGMLLAWERSLDEAWVATSRVERDVAEK